MTYTSKQIIGYISVFVLLVATTCSCSNRRSSNGRMHKSDMISTEAESFLFNSEDFGLDIVTDLIKSNKVQNLEELEARINDESSGINNVDIDNDQIIDLILVRDGRDDATKTSNIEFLAVPSTTKKEDDATLIATVNVSQKNNSVEYTADYPDYAVGYQENSYHYSSPYNNGNAFAAGMFFGYLFRPSYVPYYHPLVYPVGYHRMYMTPSVRMSTRNTFRTTTNTTRTVTKTTRNASYKAPASAKKARQNMKSGKLKPNANVAERNKQAQKAFQKRNTERTQKSATGFGSRSNRSGTKSNSRPLPTKSSTQSKRSGFGSRTRSGGGSRGFGGFGGRSGGRRGRR